MKRKKIFLVVISLVASIACLAAGPAVPKRRVALVVGNAAYKNNPLSSPVNDATDIAAALKRCGFEVALSTNLDYRGMNQAVDAFCGKASGAELALFYYSGHGAQAGENNYLIPVDMDDRGSGGAPSEADLKYYAIPLGHIADSLEQAKTQASVFILDACRSYPVKRSEKSGVAGLLPYQAPEGTAVLYATRAGEISIDGRAKAGRNSVYTAALLSLMDSPGLSILDLAAKVAAQVKDATGGKQKPSITSDITGVVYLVPASTTTTQSIPRTPPAPAPSAPSVPAGFVFVPGGTFTMGSPANEVGRYDNEVQHQVSLSSFAIAKYDVTVGEFRDFVNATGYKTSGEADGKGGYVWTDSGWDQKPDATWKNPYFPQGDQNPVVLVSWYDAVAYCNWRSKQEGRTPAYTISGTKVSCDFTANGFRLPTEAEWEYAAKGGAAAMSLAANAVYAGNANIDQVAWYWDNSEKQTHPVGEKAANSLGLFDMSGNVFEWCWDWFGDYPAAGQNDPHGPASGDRRVLRGGAWSYVPKLLRSANRNYVVPSVPRNSNGFRLLCSQIGK